MRSCFCFFFLWVGFFTPGAVAASDWFPERLSVAGHDLVRNGKRMVSTGDRDLLRVALKQWIGTDPVSKPLKQAPLDGAGSELRPTP